MIDWYIEGSALGGRNCAYGCPRQFVARTAGDLPAYRSCRAGACKQRHQVAPFDQRPDLSGLGRRLTVLPNN
jgi:hypothetical protein